MKLVEVVILVGSHCLSPMESGAGLTEVGKVPCAVLIRQDPQTSDVEIIPSSAATDPDVIAMLVKPRPEEPSAPPTIVPAAAEDITGSIDLPKPVPDSGVEGRVIEATAETLEDVAVPKPRPVAAPKKQRSDAATAKPVKTSARRTDSCGSYRAVWYTNKSGHRRYRCVKAG